MTGINANKIIQNLEFVNIFCLSIEEETENKENLFLVFLFCRTGSGSPHTPRQRRGVGENRGSACLQYGTRIRDWVLTPSLQR